MIHLDYKDSRPIYEQVADRLKELMILGVLEEDGQMPSVRSLATELSINPNTIQRAYMQLEQRLMRNWNGMDLSIRSRDGEALWEASADSGNRNAESSKRR